MATAARTPHAEAICRTQQWVVDMVIGLNLCPFARAEHVHGRIRYVLDESADESDALQILQDELLYLHEADRAQVETTLIICQQLFADFVDFNLFLNRANALLKKLKLRGDIQIASFHPHYVFADAAPDDLANYSNRSPYPILHLIREDAIARATASMDDPDAIYHNNIRLLQTLGQDEIQKRLQEFSP